MPQPRKHRRNYNIPGHAHVLTFSCYHRYQFLSAERTCVWLKDSIEATRIEHDIALWAYVFMAEHAHLLVCPRQAKYDIADIRSAIKEPVGRQAFKHLRANAPQWIPKLTRKRGKRTERLFWQSGGGYDRNIDNPATLLKEMDYIHRNPVDSKLTATASDWVWSSAGWYELGQLGPLTIDPIPADWLNS